MNAGLCFSHSSPNDSISTVRLFFIAITVCGAQPMPLSYEIGQCHNSTVNGRSNDSLVYKNLHRCYFRF